MLLHKSISDTYSNSESRISVFLVQHLIVVLHLENINVVLVLQWLLWEVFIEASLISAHN